MTIVTMESVGVLSHESAKYYLRGLIRTSDSESIALGHGPADEV
ncbi:MAG: hypothetical protein ABJH05_15470 [Fulvivirga sp.]